jgi:hypothetical protein
MRVALDHELEGLTCERCRTWMHVKWRFPKVVGPGHVLVFECGDCHGLDYISDRPLERAAG